MTDEPNEWAELLSRAEECPDGPAKVALCEQAVALAESAGDDAGAFEARLALTSAACFGGAPDVMLVAFARLLARHDESPRGYAETYQVLWRYKWVLGAVTEFPETPAAQCEALLADLTRRFAAFGAAPYAAAECEFALARNLNDKPRARAVAARLRRLRPGLLSACAACVASGLVSYRAWVGRPADAVRAAAPILDGRLSCHAVPRATYAVLLMSLWHRGELPEAMRLHRLGYKLVARAPVCVDHQARHAEFLALTGNTARAGKLVAAHLGDALASRSPADRLCALGHFRVALHHLVAAGAKPLAAKLPAGHALHRAGGRVAVADLFAAVDAEARDLARRFDARNGNATHADGLAASLTIKPKPFPYAAKG